MEAAEIVLKDLKWAERINDKSEFVGEYSLGWFDSYPDFNDKIKYPEIAKITEEIKAFESKYKEEYGEHLLFGDKTELQEQRTNLHNKKYELQNEATYKAAELEIAEKWESMKNLNLFIFSYADYDFEGAIMEHGVFQYLPHVSINKH